MTAEPVEDLETILPVEGRVTIDDIPVRVRRIRLRETMAFARILATGLGAGMLDMMLDRDDVDELKAEILGMLVVALPNAIEETLTFFTTVLEPVNPDDRGRLTESLQNPDMGDLLDVFNVLVEQEAEDIFAIVGKAQAAGNSISTMLKDRKKKADG